MRAVVVCRNSSVSFCSERGWEGLVPLVDRPFIQHVVEAIVGQGIREIDFLFEDEWASIPRALGNGTRWGATLRYYSVDGGGFAKRRNILQNLPWKDSDRLILLAHADRLPMPGVSSLTPPSTLLCWRDERLHWSGWGLFRIQDLLPAPVGIEVPKLFEYFRASCPDAAILEGKRPLTAGSYEELVDANRRLLSKDFPDLLVGGKEVEPGVWVARNVSVHPTATLVPPVFLGEHCRIGALARIGPSASIGRDCLIEEETHISDSVICEGSYVGGELALRSVLVTGSSLINTAIVAEINGVDELLLGSVYTASFRARIHRLCGRLAAASALLIGSPCLAGMFLGSLAGAFPALRKRSVVRTPAFSESYRWKTFDLWSFGEYGAPMGTTGWVRHFFFCFLPALFAVANGNIALRGPMPRTGSEISHMPPERRREHLRARSGILHFLDLHSADAQPADLRTGISSGGDEPASTQNEPEWSETALTFSDYAVRVFRGCLFELSGLTQRSKAE